MNSAPGYLMLQAFLFCWGEGDLHKGRGVGWGGGEAASLLLATNVLVLSTKVILRALHTE